MKKVKSTASLPALSALALALPYLFSHSVRAEETEVIVISASAQPESWLNSAASVELSSLPAQGIIIDSAQIFGAISGVQADSRANFAQDTRVSIRGFGSRSAFGIRGLHLQQDGIPLSTPDGQGQLSSVLLDSVAQVEVLKGPLAALYGNASGGVISLYSRTPVQNAVAASVAGSEQHRQYQLQADWVSGDHSLSTAVKQFRTDGYRPHSGAEKQQAQLLYKTLLANSVNLSARLDYARDPTLQDPLGITLSAWQQNPQQTDSAAEQFDTEKSSRHRQLSLSLSAYDDPDRWQLGSWLGDRQVNQRLAFTGSALSSAGGEVVLQRQFKGINGSYRLLAGDNYSIRAGGSLVQSDDERLGFVNDFGQRGDLRRDQTDSADNTDAFVRFNWQPAALWQVQGGWRYSELKLSIADRFILPQNPDDSGVKQFYNDAFALGLSYRIAPGFSWFVSAGTGFESPTLAEIAYQTDDTGVNLALNASTNRQWESGFKWLSDGLSASLSYFNVDSKNELLVDSNTGGRTSYRNAAKTERHGAELQLNWQTNAYLRQQLTASYLSAKFADAGLEGKRLPGIADSQLHWQLAVQPWQDNTEFALHSQYRSKVYIDDTNSNSAPSALTFSLSARHSQQWQQLNLAYWLVLDNISDKDYVGSVIVNQSNGRAIEPAPGRQLSAGISVGYNW
ncbi:iron complex outermembrane receptor protein [Rheinheimera pacifica]|uniref:TonB-dependent receptor family protein n=1 Tax=Rheinheimera pacifica TaxID=173990 RepID=UPI00285E2302|nr:TonB-dependent receptor [Rheinheimera pacifica]MDR6983781.1 iron complex outermembrane receptor protein [Rheinheimera pacifica]